MDNETRPFFYRTQQGAECDLRLERNGPVTAAIQIKLPSNAKAGKGFRISLENTRAAKGFIICNTEKTYKIDEKITITNLGHFLTYLLPELKRIKIL